MRQKFVLKHHEHLGKVASAVGHGGYVLCLLEYGVTDIIWLRLFAIGGCGMVMGFQLLQPRVQWVTFFWCGVYVAVNVFQLWQVKGASAAPLSWEEARLHAVFSQELDSGQFSSLMSLGEWLWLVDGAQLVQEGGSGLDSCVFLIASGSCEATVSGDRMADFGPGSIVGELGILSEGRHAPTATVTRTLLCVLVKALGGGGRRMRHSCGGLRRCSSGGVRTSGCGGCCRGVEHQVQEVMNIDFVAWKGCLLIPPSAFCKTLA